MATQQLVVFNGFYENPNLQGEVDWQGQNVSLLALRNDGSGFGAEFFALTTTAMKDLITVNDLKTTGQAVEISALNYTRAGLAVGVGRSIAVNTSPDRGEWLIAETDVQFGSGANIAAGQTIEAVVAYAGDVADPEASSYLMIMQEYATGRLTADGPVTVSFANQTLFWKLQQ